MDLSLIKDFKLSGILSQEKEGTPDFGTGLEASLAKEEKVEEPSLPDVRDTLGGNAEKVDSEHELPTYLTMFAYWDRFRCRPALNKHLGAQASISESRASCYDSREATVVGEGRAGGDER